MDKSNESFTPAKYEALFHSLFTTIRDVYYRTDLQGRLLMVSPSVLPVVGFTPDELRGRSMQDFEIDPHRYDVCRQRLVADGIVNDFEIEITARDGSIVPVSISGHFLYDAEGKPTAIEGIMRDITERRQAEKKLQESERRMQALVEHSADAITLLDPAGICHYASPAVSRINGYAYEEFIGQNAFTIMHPDDLPTVIRHFHRLCAKPGAIGTMQCRFQHRDGTWRWIEALGHNLLHKPAMQAIIINYRDITERKLAEKGEESNTRATGKGPHSRVAPNQPGVARERRTPQDRAGKLARCRLPL